MLREIRSSIISALCQDDEIFETLVLKGGNALDLVFRVGNRASLDIDFSMEKDLANLDRFSTRMQSALTRHFAAQNHVIFDFRLVAKPARPLFDWWGGYRAEFKLIPKALASKLSLEDMRRQAISIGDPVRTRKFKIEISKFEFCDPVNVTELNNVPVRVYAPALLAAEKLRAICQQHDEYKYNRTPHSRSRDFYDIHIIETKLKVSLSSEAPLVREVFRAKQVPWGYLADITNQQHLHEPDWPSVVDAVKGNIESFEHYFNRVTETAEKLHSLGEVDSPS